MTSGTHCPNGLLQIMSEELVFLGQPVLEPSKRFLQFWEARPSDGLVFLRDVPSRAIASLLRNIIIWDAVGDWSDARVRLMGSGLLFRFGKELKGSLLSELFAADEYTQHLALLRRAYYDNAPVLARSCLRTGGMYVMALEIIVVPLVAPDHTLPMAMVCVHPCDLAG